jgi:transposase
VALAAIKAIEHSLSWLSSSTFTPIRSTTWKAQLENGVEDIFSPNGTATAQPAIDEKSLHAKIASGVTSCSLHALFGWT